VPKQGNWDHAEVLPFIKCKKQEHVNFKPLVDPPSQMPLIAHKRDKIAKELQKLTKSRITRTGKMCKDKWNKSNSDFTKISNYHTRTSHHTSL
jgi:hypothetical protein